MFHPSAPPPSSSSHESHTEIQLRRNFAVFSFFPLLSSFNFTFRLTIDFVLFQIETCDSWQYLNNFCFRTEPFHYFATANITTTRTSEVVKFNNQFLNTFVSWFNKESFHFLSWKSFFIYRLSFKFFSGWCGVKRDPIMVQSQSSKLCHLLVQVTLERLSKELTLNSWWMRQKILNWIITSFIRLTTLKG